jgi:hypothetical protein
MIEMWIRWRSRDRRERVSIGLDAAKPVNSSFLKCSTVRRKLSEWSSV